MQIRRWSELRRHSDPERSEGEESRTGLFGAVCPTQSEVPRFARNDISWFLQTRSYACCGGEGCATGSACAGRNNSRFCHFKRRMKHPGVIRLTNRASNDRLQFCVNSWALGRREPWVVAGGQ